MDTKIDLSGCVKEVKELETVKELDKCGALLPRLFRALLVRPEIWIIKREHRIRQITVELEKKLEGIPSEKIVEPPEHIVVPTLQAISYSIDCDELRAMYVNLLAKSMNSDTTDEVHPSMVEVIKQMSPLEAQILRSLDNNENVAYFNIVRKTEGASGQAVLYRYISKYDPEDAVLVDFQPLPSSVAISNLGRLGIFALHDDAWISADSFYENIMPSRIAKAIEELNKRNANMQSKITIQTQKGCATLTPFGKAFIKICIS